MRIRALPFVGLCALAAVAGNAFATVNVSPTRVVLAPASVSGAVTLRNLSSSAASFQVKPFAWSNGPGGRMQLEPTADVIVFPLLFTIEPGMTRTLRIGLRTRSAATERSYRLLIEELPRESDTGSGDVIMRTQLSIPVFASPQTSRAQVTLHPPALSQGVVSVRLFNSGAVHATPARFHLIAHSADGAILWRRELAPWYLLAGEDRQQAVPLTADECRAAHSLSAEVDFEERPLSPLREQIAVTWDRCSP